MSSSGTSESHAQAANSSHSQPVCVVVGAGTGLGSAIARRFARAGYAVAVCARSKEKLETVSHDINQTLQQESRASDHGTGSSTSTGATSHLGVVRPFAMDCTDESSVKEAFAEIRKQFAGPIRVLVYNAAQRKFRTEDVLQVSTATFENFWRVNCFGALLCARQALPSMLEAPVDPAADPCSPSALHRGSLLLTGATASLRCMAGLTSMSVGKFGLRALAQGMAREFGPRGVHVAHVVIDGAIDSPLLRSYVKGQLNKKAGAGAAAAQAPPFDTRFLQPDAIAEEYFRLHTQHPSTWTQELDLRPHVEPIYSRM